MTCDIEYALIQTQDCVLISGLSIGDIDLCIGMVQGLKERPPYVKGSYLRAMINSHALVYKEPIEKILKSTGPSILKWFEDEKIKLCEEERLRLMASIMRLKNDIEWFMPDDEG